MKILVDMNLSPLWIDTFNKNGWEALHWSEVGDSRAKDRELMSWARKSGHIVFTNDLDFGHLLALTHASGPSVIQVRSKDLLPESIGPVVLRALRENQEALRSGALVVIDPEDFRVRILPI
jgi:predicted nuclease of predicted toxin-antitoxin system